MTLPLEHTYKPMEATTVDELPPGGEWQIEPKWDGFRCLAFRDGSSVDLRSKAGKPLGRYFPEIVEAIKDLRPRRFVLDGELVLPEGKSLSFDQLLQRIHPAASRIEMLSSTHPALYIVFDLLVDAKGKLCTKEDLETRRAALEAFAAEYFPEHGQIRLSPETNDRAVVSRWKKTIGGGLDGLIAKRRDMPYRSGTRDGMQKVKFRRTADCVVGGFRFASKGGAVGSLLLGLYDESGLLNHVGFTSSFSTGLRRELSGKLEPYRGGSGFTGSAPGGPSRWSTERSAEWEPLEPELVVEVEYDHFTNGRFRHGTKFLRWRPDKAPGQCDYSQLGAERRSALAFVK
jgi:ATP-dependent DNA ligase